MSGNSASLKKTIKEIKRLADGSVDDQLKACEKLLQKKILPYGKPKPEVNELVIRELLPTIFKFMESNDHRLQKEGANSIYRITSTPNEAYTKFFTDAGGITILKKFLSSPNTDVLISTLEAFINIAYDCPEKVVENEILQSMIQCLKSDNKLITFYSAWFMRHISFESVERIAAIFDANGVQPLIEIFESKNYDVIEHVLWSLIHITSCNADFCKRIMDFGFLKSLKKLCGRLFVATKKFKKEYHRERDLKSLRQRKIVNPLALRLIKLITSYGEALVDMVIQEKFLPLILQQIKGGITPEIKIVAIKVIENVISVKPDLIPAIVEDYNIFSFCYNNLGSSNIKLLIKTLTAMSNIIEASEGRDIIRQKIRECGGTTKLSNLLEHSYEEIRHLSRMIYEFVFDVKPIAGVAADVNLETELIELNSEDDDIPVTPQSGQQRKRRAITPPTGPLRRSKRFMVSLEQADSETSDSSSSDDDDSVNDQSNDFDDHPINSSPAGAASSESNRNDHSGSQSSFGNDTVATDDGPSRLHPKAEPQPTPPNVDMPTTSASHQPLDLSLAASTNNETDQNEIKPSIVGRLGNRSRRASNNSHVKLEAASTNDGNIRDNDVGRQIAVDSETAATADGIVRNAVNPGKQSPTDDDTSAIAPALPVASASTNNGTMPDASIKYWRPAEFLIHQYCGTLEIQFNRKDYDEFIPKIIFAQITSNSKPDTVFQPIDQTGFGCLSILLTGNEDASSAIRMKINKKFIDDLMQSGNFDEEKITSVISPPFLMKEEHLQTIATWLKCRILVYCNGWKKYGNWDEENPMIPIFVLEMKEIDGKTEYSVVLTLKNE